MASSDIWDPRGVFVITDGPGDGDFTTYFPSHLRNPQSGYTFRFNYSCPEGVGSGSGHFVITAIEYRRLGRYCVRAVMMGPADGVTLSVWSMIEGYYDPSQRKGYFRVVPHPGEVGALVKKDTQADQRWATYVIGPSK